MFGDPLLDRLQDQVDISNQNLAKAEAQYRQALALLQSARAGFYPDRYGRHLQHAFARIGDDHRAALRDAGVPRRGHQP